jgi:hypothetical protein
MQKNVGPIERIIRIGVGAALLTMAYFNQGTYLYWIGLIGILPIVTGIMQWCPANLVLGIKIAEK